MMETRRQRQAEAPAAAATQGRQYLTFTVAGEMFGIAISAIREILEYRTPTDVPMMPSYMRGVINLRGRVVPVVDLSARFGRGMGEATRRTCFVILELRHDDVQHEIGIVVDAVSAVLEIADAEIEPPPNFGTRLRADFITGLGNVADKFVILLDVDKVLSVDELSRLPGGEQPGDLQAQAAA